MQLPNKVYKFRSRVLPDGHMSIPDEVAKNGEMEYEVILTPVDDIKSSISLHLEGRVKKSGRIADIYLDSAKITESIKSTFGTTDIDTIIQAVRR